jgi:hypothetical protein
MTLLSGKKVIVVGGTSGVGYAVAHAVLAEGASVVVCSSSATKVEAAVVRLQGGERVRGEVLDVTSEDGVKAFFESSGKFDHLVYTVRHESSSPCSLYRKKPFCRRATHQLRTALRRSAWPRLKSPLTRGFGESFYARIMPSHTYPSLSPSRQELASRDQCAGRRPLLLETAPFLLLYEDLQ